MTLSMTCWSTCLPHSSRHESLWVYPAPGTRPDQSCLGWDANSCQFVTSQYSPIGLGWWSGPSYREMGYISPDGWAFGPNPPGPIWPFYFSPLQDLWPYVKYVSKTTAAIPIVAQAILRDIGGRNMNVLLRQMVLVSQMMLHKANLVLLEVICPLSRTLNDYGSIYCRSRTTFYLFWRY